MITSTHHIGCLVPDIQAAIADYRKLHPSGMASEIFHITEQQVNVCFFDMGNINIEFVAPLNQASALYRMLIKNPGFYHIGVVTDNINEEIARLEKEGYRLINQFPSAAFSNRSCAFLYNEELHLIELIEQQQS